MDRQFKKKAYTASVLISLVFFSIVVATYIDNYTCPMLWRLIVQNHDKTEALRTLRHEQTIQRKIAHCEQDQKHHKVTAPSSSPKQGNIVDEEVRERKDTAINCTKTVLDDITAMAAAANPSATQLPHPLAALVPNSVFHPHFHYIPCNMMDLLVHCYSVWFILFMAHKWLMYKRAGWHYFMLDYCYFHNVLFIFFIFYILVKVDVVGVVDDGVAGSGANVNSSVNLKHVKASSSAVLRTEGEKSKKTAPDTTQHDLQQQGADDDDEVQLNAILNGGFTGVLYGMATDLAHNLFSGMLLRRYIVDTSRNGLRLGCKATQGIYDAVMSDGDGEELDMSVGGLVAACDAVSTTIDMYVTPILGPASVTEIYSEMGMFVVSDSHSTNKANRRTDGSTSPTTYLQEMALLASLQSRVTRTEVFVRVQPLREAVADLTQDQKARMVVLFIMFLSGSFGPILGAIVIWKNALLFHSIDKMTACFLHLAPGLVTLMLLNSIHSSSQVHLFASGGSAIDSLYSPQTLGSTTPIDLSSSVASSPLHSSALHAIVPSFVFAHPLFNALKSTYEEGVDNFNTLADSAKRALYKGQHRDVEFLKNLNENESEDVAAAPKEPRRRRPTGALRTSSVFLTIFSQFISLKDFILSHFVLFCLWQLFYHTTFELLAARRKIVFKVKRKRIERNIKKLTKEVKKEAKDELGVTTLDGVSPLLPPSSSADGGDAESENTNTTNDDEFEEIEVDEDEAVEMERTHTEMLETLKKKKKSKSASTSSTPPPSPGLAPTATSSIVAKYELLQRKEHELQLLGASGTNPTNRVTAYTYMMENPPMGKRGPLYRCATLFGEGPLVSKVMFNVMQWLFHCVFLVIGYIPLYLSLIAFQNVFIMAAYFFLFLIFSIWNSAGVLDGWIRKLQREADVQTKSDLASATATKKNGA